MHQPLKLLLTTLCLWLLTLHPGHADSLKIGIRSDAQLLEYVTADGTPSGELVEHWKQWGNVRGYTLEFIAIGDAKAEQLLNDRVLDILANAPPKMQTGYSQVYDKHAYYFITRTGNYLTRLNELPLAIGILASDAPFLTDILVERGPLVSFRNYHEMLSALQQGKIGIIAANDIALNMAITTTDLLKLHYADEPFYIHPVRAAALPHNQHLLRDFTNLLERHPPAQSSSFTSRWHPSALGFRLPWTLIGAAATILCILSLMIFFWLMNKRLEQQVKAQTDEIAQQKQELEIDIERRKTLEVELKWAKAMAEAAADEKSRFLATMTHELRTPLIGVLGMNEQMQQTPITDHQRSLLNIIQDSGETLLSLVNDLLDFSKIETGKLSLRLEHLNLPELVTKTTTLLRGQAEDKGLELHCSIAPEASWNVEADALRLQQILLNLLSNAIKFTPTGRVSVRLKLVERQQQLGIFALEVEDSGIGMHSEERETIFSPFVQADNAHSVIARGTGLGLAIVEQLIEMMSGTVTVDSQPGQGSLFRATFNVQLLDRLAPEPAKVASDVKPPPPPTGTGEVKINETRNPPPSGTLNPAARRLLVVDDYPATRELVKQSLISQDLMVDEADSGAVALTLCETNSYGLILMDCSMPKMDGLETTRRLRERSCNAPIVALTAHSDTETINACLDAGMNDSLPKPFRQKQLFALLEKWLNPEEGEDGNV